MLYVLIAIVVIILIAVLWYIATRNGIIASRNRVDESWSGIDVQLKRRHDLVPNLVETVKGYATHEQKVFEEVTKARADAMAAQSVGDTAQAESGLNRSLADLRAVAEQYPDLKATENFQQLSRNLSELERPELQHEDPAVPRLDRRQPGWFHGQGVLRDRRRRRTRHPRGQLLASAF